MDWQKILSANIPYISNDEDVAEDFFHLLCQVDISDQDKEANDPQLMVKLFHVSKAVLSVKGLQYDAALEEMEKMTEETAAEREKELLSEIEQLQLQLAQHQRYTGSGEKYLRMEIVQLEDKNQALQRELDDFEKRLLKEQSSYDRVNIDLQSLASQLEEKRRELAKAQSDIKEYQRQFQSQRESKLQVRGSIDIVRDEISKKNRELSEYLDEIKQLQDTNDNLQSEINEAKKELENATEDMNSMVEDYQKLKGVLEATDTIVEELRKERDHLRNQVQDMHLQMQSKAEGDDEIMSTLNRKVAEWKNILTSKDAEIKAKTQQAFELQKQLQASNMDADQNHMMELVDANADKDKQIGELKEKLEMAMKDYNDVTNQINALNSQRKDDVPSIYQQKQIKLLSNTIEEDQKRIIKEKLRSKEAEKDVIDKDKEIAELVNRLIQYEQGQYGLSEAVQELKESRAQIRVRDSNIEELTREINRLLIEVNDLNDENEEMRERLGLDSREEIDITTIRKKKAVKEEQAIALNLVLQNEVEKLEEERVQLKKALRKQALDRGEKFVELGLSTKDVEIYGDDILPISSKSFHTATNSAEDTTKKAVVTKSDNKDHEVWLLDNKKLEKEVKELREENKQLEIGLREINGILHQGLSPSGVMQVPALDRLIAIIEQRNATGQYDMNQHLKGQIHQLIGGNEEIRCELKNAHHEINIVTVELDKKIQKIANQEKEIDMLKKANKEVIKLKPLPLPEGIVPTSKEIIGCLNEYLIQILQELSNKENLCTEMKDSLEEVRRRYSVAKHKQSILYKEFLKFKETSETSRKCLEEEKDELLLQKSLDAVRIQEFNKLLDNLESCNEKPKRVLSELSRKLTVLRVNEKSLARRFTIIQEVEKCLRKENAKLRKDILDMESTVTTKIGDLERHKEMSSYKISALQKQLGDTVPLSELEMTNRKFNELTSKYRDLLQRENMLIGRSLAFEGIHKLKFDWLNSSESAAVL